MVQISTIETNKAEPFFVILSFIPLPGLSRLAGRKTLILSRP